MLRAADEDLPAGIGRTAPGLLAQRAGIQHLRLLAQLDNVHHAVVAHLVDLVAHDRRRRRCPAADLDRFVELLAFLAGSIPDVQLTKSHLRDDLAVGGRTRHLAGSVKVVPDKLVRHVALERRIDRHRTGSVAVSRNHVLARENRTGSNVPAHRVGLPENLALLGRIVTHHPWIPGRHDLVLAVNRDHDRGGPAWPDVRTLGLPGNLARLGLQRNQLGSVVGIPLNDHQVLVENRAAGIAVSHRRKTQVLDPELVAIQIERADVPRGEHRYHRLAVGGRRAGCPTVLAERLDVVGPLLAFVRHHFLFPENLARLGIQAVQRGRYVTRLGCTGAEDLLAPDHRRRRSGQWKRSLPGDVLARFNVPLDSIPRIGSISVAARTPEARPGHLRFGLGLLGRLIRLLRFLWLLRFGLGLLGRLIRLLRLLRFLLLQSGTGEHHGGFFLAVTFLQGGHAQAFLCQPAWQEHLHGDGPGQDDHRDGHGGIQRPAGQEPDHLVGALAMGLGLLLTIVQGYLYRADQSDRCKEHQPDARLQAVLELEELLSQLHIQFVNLLPELFVAGIFVVLGLELFQSGRNHLIVVVRPRVVSTALVVVVGLVLAVGLIHHAQYGQEEQAEYDGCHRGRGPDHRASICFILVVIPRLCHGFLSPDRAAHPAGAFQWDSKRSTERTSSISPDRVPSPLGFGLG